MRKPTFYSFLLCIILLAGCSSSPSKRLPPAPPLKTQLSDPIMVIVQLKSQLEQWYGTPYRYGGMSPSGIDCSGFVYRTYSDRFDIQLPRMTIDQTKYGTQISIFSKQEEGITGFMLVFMILTIPLFMLLPVKALFVHH